MSTACSPWSTASCLSCPRSRGQQPLEAQRIGVVTRQLAARAAILMVPTAIAGIYGMNFKHMPELDTPYGYFCRARSDSGVLPSPFMRFRRPSGYE